MRTCRGKGWILYWLNKAGAVFFIALAVILLIAAFQRNNLWVDEYALMTDAIRKSPDKGRPYLNLGLFYFNENRIDDAIKEYATALRLAPGYASAHNNMGVAYYKKGYIDAAIAEFKDAVQLYPGGYAEAHYNLGIAYGEKGLSEQAYVEIKKAMDLNKNFTEELKKEKWTQTSPASLR